LRGNLPEVNELLDLYPKKETKHSKEVLTWIKGSKLSENGKPIEMYHGTTSDFENFKDGWNFISSDPNYARNFSGGKLPKSVFVSIKNPIDLRSLSGKEDLNPKEVSKELEKHGIVIPEEKLGRGEIHQILMPVRDEILKQAARLGFDGLVQNENFAGNEVESWAAFTGKQLRPSTK